MWDTPFPSAPALPFLAILLWLFHVDMGDPGRVSSQLLERKLGTRPFCLVFPHFSGGFYHPYPIGIVPRGSNMRGPSTEPHHSLLLCLSALLHLPTSLSQVFSLCFRKTTFAIRRWTVSDKHCVLSTSSCLSGAQGIFFLLFFSP